MVDTTTPNLGLTKPEVGASDDVWGNKLNGNFDLLDTAVTAKVAKSGGAMTGLLTLSGGPAVDLGAATKKYVDDKVASVGGGVTQAYVDTGDAMRVLKSGDTMIGQLKLSYATPVIILDDTGTVGSFIQGTRSGAANWNLALGTQANGDLVVNRFNPPNTYVDNPFVINRTTGQTLLLSASIAGVLGVTGNLAVGGEISHNGILRNPNGYFWMNGTEYIIEGGPLRINQGTLKFGTNANNIIFTDGNNLFYRSAGHYFQNVAGTVNEAVLDVAGNLTIGGGFTGGGAVIAHDYVMTGSANVVGNMRYYFGNSATKYLDWNGTQFTFVGGLVSTNGSRIDGGDIHASGYLFADNGNLYLSGTPGFIRGGNYTNLYDGVDPKLIIGNAADPFTTYKNNTHQFQHSNGTPLLQFTYPEILFWPYEQVKLGAGFMGHAGISASTYQYVNNLNYDGAGMQLWVDTSNLGYISVTCDYRAKQDVKGLPSTWKQVLDLRPISYTQKDFTPPGSMAQMAVRSRRFEEEGVDSKDIPEFQHVVKEDGVQRWGFVAHELQETLLPSAASGEKDDPFAVQSPNALAVLAAVTRALQEAMLRIEVLESKLAGRAK